ncbi:MAG: DUF192 domain-containing protein [Candidatus Omnitrophota bacterium]
MMKTASIIVLGLLFCQLFPCPYSYAQDGPDFVNIRCGDVELSVEVAADAKSRDRGLMRRESIPKGSGMLFVYPSERICRLWMKNTFIPLSAAFIDKDGKILQILDMKKINSTKIYRSKKKAQYALEVSLGWFAENGVVVGDYCEIPDIQSR